jgi:hypothetical protein
MTGCPTLEELHGYLTRAKPLGPDQIDRVEAHVEACDSCFEVLDRLLAEIAPSDRSQRRGGSTIAGRAERR